MAEALVLLHGFAGTHRTWDAVCERLEERYRPMPVDLPGHGAAANMRPITFAGCVAHVLAEAPPRFALCGYSMGGRLALVLALTHPQRVTSLTLLSTSAGIEDPAERARRQQADQGLAGEVESAPIGWFVERWAGQPLFAGDPDWVRDLAAEDYRRNDPGGLASALRGVGTGAMEPAWGRLAELPMPVTVVVGERDAKFAALGERLSAACPGGRLIVAPGAGHALAIEAPDTVAAAIEAGGSARARSAAAHD
jgi:2-succinyl-6-hydroxy-2,4-cyclohexadiene-1-carboxylate synthase